MNGIYVLPSSVPANLLYTELNSLASNSVATGVLYNLSNNYLAAEVQFHYKFTNTPTANTSCDLYFLRTLDGHVFEDGGIVAGSSIVPPRYPNLVFGVTSTPDNLSHDVIKQTVLPPGSFITLMKNNGTGQPLGTGNYVRILPNTLQII